MHQPEQRQGRHGHGVDRHAQPDQAFAHRVIQGLLDHLAEFRLVEVGLVTVDLASQELDRPGSFTAARVRTSVRYCSLCSRVSSGAARSPASG